MDRRGIRRRWKTLFAVPVVLGTLVAVGWPVYVDPPWTRYESADAAVVLGTAYPDRVLAAYRLKQAGRVGVVAVSLASSAPRELVSDLTCGVEVICFTPDPPTTRGEVHAVNGLARLHGWGDVIVVTGTPHVVRARFIFSRCSDVRVTVIEFAEKHDVVGWAYQYGYQSAAFVKAALVSCDS